MKKVFTAIIYILVVTSILPTIITLYIGNKINPPSVLKNSSDNNTVDNADYENNVKVYNPETEEISNVGFEYYIKGVVAAEMPALFEKEALKAQAVAARTYAIKHSDDINNIEADKIGQAYISVEQMKENWGDKFNEYYERISDAVESTQGEIMVYNNEPIEAVFHSTSAGITESAENIWSSSLPYLKSVDSSQDEKAPDFIHETSIAKTDFIKKLKPKHDSLNITNDNIMDKIKILSRTEAGYVDKVSIDDKIFTGKEVRELFGLRSSNFTIKQDSENIIFITKGYGHGAGMSQYGANFMAEQGSKYSEILNHYYNEINIEKIKD